MEYNIWKYMRQQRLLHRTPTVRFLTVEFYLAIVLITTLYTTDVLGSTLGSKCQHDMDCTDFIKGSSCSAEGKCECAPYYVQYNTTSCLSSQLLGGDCTLNEQCTMKVANSSCLDGACRCVEGFLQFRKHTCLGPAPPGSVCYSHAHCQMFSERSHCDFLIPNLFGRCQCTAPTKLKGGLCVDNTIEEISVPQTTTTKITMPTTATTQASIIENTVSQNVMADPVQHELETANHSVEEQEWDDDSKDSIEMATKTSSNIPDGQTTPTVLLTPPIADDHSEEEIHENVDNAGVPNVTDDYPYKIDEEEEEHTESQNEKHIPIKTDEVVMPEEEHIEEEHVEDYGDIVDNTMNFDYEAAKEEMEHEQQQEEELQEVQQQILENKLHQIYKEENNFDSESGYEQMEVEMHENSKESDLEHVNKEEPNNSEQEHVPIEIEEVEEIKEHEPGNLEEVNAQIEQEQEQHPEIGHEEDNEQEDESHQHRQEESSVENHEVKQEEQYKDESQIQTQQLEEEHREQESEKPISDYQPVHKTESYQPIQPVQQQENEREQQEPELEQLKDLEKQQSHDQHGYLDHHQEVNQRQQVEMEQEQTRREEHKPENEEKPIHGPIDMSDRGSAEQQEYEYQKKSEEKNEQEYEENKQENKNSMQQHPQEVGYEELQKQEQKLINHESDPHGSGHAEQVSQEEHMQSQEYQPDNQPEQAPEPNIVEQLEEDNANNEDFEILVQHQQQQPPQQNEGQQQQQEQETNSIEPENILETQHIAEQEHQQIAESDHVTQLNYLSPYNDDKIINNIPSKQQQQEESQTNKDEESLNQSINSSAITNEIHDGHHEHYDYLTSVQHKVVMENESVQSEKETTVQQQQNEEEKQPEAIAIESGEVNTTQTVPIEKEAEVEYLENVDTVENNKEDKLLENNDNKIDADNSAVSQTANYDGIVEQQQKQNQQEHKHDKENTSSMQETTEELPRIENQTESSETETEESEDFKIQSEDKINKILIPQQLPAAEQISQDVNDSKQLQQELGDRIGEEKELEKEISASQSVTETNMANHSDEEQIDSHDDQYVDASLKEKDKEAEHSYLIEKTEHVEQHDERPLEVNEIEQHEYDDQVPLQIDEKKLAGLAEINQNKEPEEETLNEDTTTQYFTSNDYTEEDIQGQEVDVENSENSIASKHQTNSAIQGNKDDLKDSTLLNESKYEQSQNTVEAVQNEDDNAHTEAIKEVILTSENVVQKVENDQNSHEVDDNKIEEKKQEFVPKQDTPERNQVEEEQQELEHLSLENNKDQQQLPAVEANETVDQEAQNQDVDNREVEIEEMETSTQINDVNEVPLKDHHLLNEMTHTIDDSEFTGSESQQQLDIQDATASSDSFENNEVSLEQNAKHPQNNYSPEDIVSPNGNEQFKESESISDILNDLIKGGVTIKPEFAESSNYNNQHTDFSEEEITDLIAEDSNISEETVMSHEAEEHESTESPIPPEDKLITFYPDMQEIHADEIEASGDDQETTEVSSSEDLATDHTLSPLEVPFDTSIDYEPQKLEADNLVVETTTTISSYQKLENNNELTEVTTTANAVQEVTTQTMLNLASRVTLMEPAAPIVTTLKPLMSTNPNEEVTAEPAVDTPVMDTLSTSKPITEIRKRVELSLEAVSLGLSCSTNKQCQLADPYTICNAHGKCDCAANIFSMPTHNSFECGAERTGCAPGTFQCRSSGVCISWFFVCDGRSDCNDASDEECNFNARLNQTCPSQAFKCSQSGRCISRAALCDGRKQCPHGEDEIGCSALKSKHSCPPYTFKCKSGECLPEYEYCNAIISCRDGSDEPPHLCGSRSMPNFFLQLLTAGGLMNKNMEANAYCPHRCSNGRCRSTAIVCSGRDGCGDGTDEQTCSVCRCPAISTEQRPAINVSEFLARHQSMPLW